MKKTIFGRHYGEYFPIGLNNGLISYYKLDNNAIDEKGVNNGVLGVNTNFQSGALNQAPLFNGNRDSSIKVMANSDISVNVNGLSISFWIYDNIAISNQTEIGYIVTKLRSEEGVTNYIDLAISRYQNLMYAEFYSANGGYKSAMVYYNYANFPENQWNHVVCTYDGSGLSSGCKIYVNGLLPDQLYEGNNIPIVHTPISGAMRIGSQNFNLPVNNVGYKGKVDEVGFWKRELSPEEVIQLKNLQSYPFN